jgi:carboxymethylenebutenolidase
MCYDISARPPLPPIAGGAGMGETRELVLEAGDGNQFAAYSATTASPGGPGIVVMPDVRGLYRFYKELAERFAEAGVHATAIDYFGRSAGVAERDGDFDYMPHVAETLPETIAADVAAAVAHLRSTEGGGAEAVFTVGFCFGGRNSFNQAAAGHGLAGVIGFYGFVARRDDDDKSAPVDLAKDYRSPVLGLFGGADQHILPEHVAGFRAALDSAGVGNDVVTYDGAPHSFFDRTAREHADASADAWRRMLEFIQTNRTGGAPAPS